MRLDRRLAIKMTMAALAAAAVGGHTPYGQWTVYRRRNLFIVASRTDEAALALARAVVDGLSLELPESRAKVTRATDPVRIASLLATGQLDVAGGFTIRSSGDARRLRRVSRRGAGRSPDPGGTRRAPHGDGRFVQAGARLASRQIGRSSATHAADRRNSGGSIRPAFAASSSRRCGLLQRRSD